MKGSFDRVRRGRWRALAIVGASAAAALVVTLVTVSPASAARAARAGA
ncbi:hypothetical protein [Fodinicola feengrottensis]|nr:hypothetical protein [Fodinicola feengrottensis]